MGKNHRIAASRDPEETCDCVRCQLLDVILEVGGVEAEDGRIEFCPTDLAIDLVPTMALILAGITYDGCEEWWKIVLEARSHALEPAAAEMPPAMGRA